MFARLNIMPRWIIFLLDVICSVFSLGFAYVIRHSFDIDQIDIYELSRNLFIFALICSVIFLCIKTYAGIIRYTSTQDAVRILLAIVLSNGLFLIVNTALVFFDKDTAVQPVVLVINGLVSFLLLIIYRVTVKYFFIYVKNLEVVRRQVIIYGAGDIGLAAKRTLDHDPKVNMKVLAFIDDEDRKSGKVIEGVKIYHTSEIGNLVLEHELDDLIIADHDLHPDKKNAIVDFCLENNIKVLTLPPADSWINGQVSSQQIQNIKIEDLLERDGIIIHNEVISDQLKGKRILVTGAAGSIGSEIARQVLRFHPQMLILNDQSETPLHELQLELQEHHSESNFHCFIGDVRDANRMELLFKTFKPHYVYHAAAYKHVPLMEDNPAEAIRTNVLGTKTLADLSVKYGLKRFVMISTDKAVNPTNVMGASKRIAEIYVQSLNNSLHNTYQTEDKTHPLFITTRFGNVLGSNGSVIPRFTAQLQKGGPVTVTHPEITRYFMTIPEACRLVLEAGSMGNGGEIFVFDMGKSVKIVDLAKKMIRLSGLVPNQDIAIEFSGLRPGEKLYEELLNDQENTIHTHHEKIMIGKVREYDFNSVSICIDELLKLSSSFQDRQVVIKMKEIVPEFKSNNSAYEELDLQQIQVQDAQ
ncbi:MAG TPA: nucleoside-diphosphate sugar epimerase/dehydratase [Daejeonella sp.]|nr:nucleoside-diphosphate sugar epimerase/dehydratase [Daejeonella sp.]